MLRGWDRDLLFVNAFIGRRVKHLIRPGAIRIIDSRALEQTVRAVAVLFELATGSLYLSAHFPKDLIRKRPLKKAS